MSAQQITASLRFAPLLPEWAIVLLGLACLAALAVAASRRAPGLAWRALAFAVVLGFLCGPRLMQETRTPLPDIGLLVIDQSQSMSVGNRASLAASARAALEADAHRSPGLELRTVTVPETGQEGTRLFAAVDRALAGIPRAQLAGIVVVTDGQIHDLPPKPRYGVPIHFLLAAHGEEIDRRIRLIEAPEYGVVGKSVHVRFVVDDLGAAHPAPSVPIVIRRDGEVWREDQVAPGASNDIEVPITREGPTLMEIVAAPMPGEASLLNNRTTFEINGVRDRLRVLLVSGEPHAGERTWRRLLKADPAVDLVHFTILRPPEKDDLTPLSELALIAFPTRELFQQKIREFDLIILDRFQNRGILPLPYLRNIADYVREGGALLLSVGPEFVGPGSLDDTPLHAVLPAHPLRQADGEVDSGAVVEGAYRPLVTPLGARHPVTADLPGWHEAGPPSWGSWYRRVAVDDVHGNQLLSAGQDAPLLLLDRVGKGRIAMLLSDQIWLWSRGHQGGGPQAELLRRVAHWLMRQPALEENTLTARIVHSAAGDMLTVTRHSTQDAAGPPVTVRAPDGSPRTLALQANGPGAETARMPAPLPGVWEASDGTRRAFAAASVANPLEIADLRATATLVEPLAQASGGSDHWLATADGHPSVPDLRRSPAERPAYGDNWIGLPARNAHVVTALAAVPLLPDWLALALLAGLIIVAWWREAV